MQSLLDQAVGLIPKTGTTNTTGSTDSSSFGFGGGSLSGNAKGLQSWAFPL
jgi:hypothetical protein